MKVVIALFSESPPLFPVEIEAQTAMIDTAALSSSHPTSLHTELLQSSM